ncbi:MAG TPA: hypothetical protein GX401_03875 [Clostridiales bacterium]|nr:hypothetical protein [Clostridiales bacterium]
MNYALIFYTARKTGYCEAALNRTLDNGMMEAKNISAAVSSEDFGRQMNYCLAHYDFVVVIGDVERTDENGLMPVLSAGLGTGEKDFTSQKLMALNTATGYVLTADNKVVIVLPDEPKDIERLASVTLINYIKSVVVK